MAREETHLQKFFYTVNCAQIFFKKRLHLECLLMWPDQDTSIFAKWM